MTWYKWRIGPLAWTWKENRIRYHCGPPGICTWRHIGFGFYWMTEREGF